MRALPFARSVSTTAPASAGLRPLTLVCLATLYIVWGSTYLAMRVAVTSFAPLQLGAVRFLCAGGVLYLVLRLRGAPSPTVREWASAAAVGVCLMVVGLGSVSVALTHVSSGVAAVVFGSVPLWTTLFDWLTRSRSARRQLGGREVLGLAVGFVGVLFVAARGTLRASPGWAVVLCLAAAGYSFGCVLSTRLPLPRGPMATAAQMLAGGAVLALGSLVRGEAWPAHVSVASAVSLVHLCVLGSIAAYSALTYLLRTERPSLATSYAFVNPIVALILGAMLGGEHAAAGDWAGVVLVIAAVALVASAARTSR